MGRKSKRKQRTQPITDNSSTDKPTTDAQKIDKPSTEKPSKPINSKKYEMIAQFWFNMAQYTIVGILISNALNLSNLFGDEGIEGNMNTLYVLIGCILLSVIFYIAAVTRLNKLNKS